MKHARLLLLSALAEAIPCQKSEISLKKKKKHLPWTVIDFIFIFPIMFLLSALS